MIFTLSSCDDPHIVIWWSSNHQGGHYQAARPWISIRYASPCSPLILNFQWCKLHFLISSSAIASIHASMHHSVHFLCVHCARAFYASMHLLVQFLAWLQAWKVISVSARAFYASLHLFVQFQEQFLCVQGRNMFLCFCVCKGNLCFYALFGAISMQSLCVQFLCARAT